MADPRKTLESISGLLKRQGARSIGMVFVDESGTEAMYYFGRPAELIGALEALKHKVLIEKEALSE